MKLRYRLFKRGWGVYYCEDTETKKQESLGTSDKHEAERLVQAKNESAAQPAFSIHLARVYWKAGDPAAASRTWQFVMDEVVKTKHGETKSRWETAVKDGAFSHLRSKVLLETGAEDLLRALHEGTVSTNVYLRRLHNFALDLSWLPWPILPKKRWPALLFKEKRAITLAEHKKIVEREQNAERKAFYELAWHLGASQSDIAFLQASDIDNETQVISYARKKSGELAFVRFGPDVKAILDTLPKSGPLFPYLRKVRASDRATEFKQRCVSVGVSGVTLHSYRYAWAERAKKAAYPERFAQQALGHNSKAVHRAYAKQAKVILPPLEIYERTNRSEQKEIDNDHPRLAVAGQ
jgi:integrase